jgi:hypothetical protein
VTHVRISRKACVYYTNVAHATFAWRFPLAVQILFPLIVLACSGLLPYSPRWLLSKGRDDEALATLERLHSKKGDTDHVLAKEEYYLIKKQFAVDAALKIRPFELFRGKANELVYTLVDTNLHRQSQLQADWYRLP